MSQKMLDTSLDQSIKLDIPGGEYCITTYRETDVDAMFEAFQIESVSDELISVPKPYTRDSARFWLNAQLEATRALLPLSTVQERNKAFFDKDSDKPLRQVPLMVIRHGTQMIGCCSISPASCSPQVGELGYWLHPDYHHKRIMQAATRAILKYSANEFGVRKVIGRAEGGNIASQKIIAKLAEEMGGNGGGVAEPTRAREKWPENKKGGEERDVLTWAWSVRPDGEF
ncbi:acyl-CoA N-acyltransferase [Rhexocercosporidium sp. MPI-PUGE-AT-0058]|nr:acyl-CoA N-acyltransferase [Rhexocercosporidium sp. MPI-PUGE-AT-0058]